MGDYSKLKSVEVINFMGFLKAKIVADETGSWNLKGYNSSGKSAFLTACAVAMMNVYPNKQLKYIHHGKDYFRIILSFDDGVVIVRDKYKNGQSLYEMYKGEEKVYTSKSGDKLTKIDAVPSIIEGYLGMIGTELGYLNYQVRRDPLWLVETRGSDNYYTLNEVLKSVEIAEANALLNADKNALNTDITIVESEYNTLNTQLAGMSTVGDELLGRLYERQSLVSDLWNQYDMLNKIAGIIKELSETEILPEIERIESDRLVGIQRVGSLLSQLEGIQYFKESIENISLDRYNAIGRIVTNLKETQKISYFDGEIGTIEGTGKLKDLNKLSSLVNEMSEAVRELGSLKTTFQSLEDEREALIEQASKQGITFTVCTNCGTLLEVKNG